MAKFSGLHPGKHGPSPLWRRQHHLQRVAAQKDCNQFVRIRSIAAWLTVFHNQRQVSNFKGRSTNGHRTPKSLDMLCQGNILPTSSPLAHSFGGQGYALKPSLEKFTNNTVYFHQVHLNNFIVFQILLHLGSTKLNLPCRHLVDLIDLIISQQKQQRRALHQAVW